MITDHSSTPMCHRQSRLVRKSQSTAGPLPNLRPRRRLRHSRTLRLPRSRHAIPRPRSLRRRNSSRSFIRSKKEARKPAAPSRPFRHRLPYRRIPGRPAGPPDPHFSPALHQRPLHRRHLLQRGLSDRRRPLCLATEAARRDGERAASASRCVPLARRWQRRNHCPRLGRAQLSPRQAEAE